MIQKAHKKRKKNLTSKIILAISIASVVAYTTSAFLLQFNGNMEISPTLTTCFFTFFTVEIFNLTSIKKSKIKNNYDSQTSTEQVNNNASDI